MKNILLIFSVLILLKFVINVYYLIYLQFLKNKYQKHLKDKSNFYNYRQQAISLFKLANIKDKTIPYQELAGFNRILTANLSLFENAAVMHGTIVNYMAITFSEANGVFKQRVFESFNPFYWILFVINLPEHFLKYLGLSPESVIVKIFKIIWWLICILTTIAYELIKNKIINI